MSKFTPASVPTPKDRLHYSLWLMGFNEGERERIISISREYRFDTIGFGRFLLVAREKVETERIKELGKIATENIQ